MGFDTPMTRMDRQSVMMKTDIFAMEETSKTPSVSTSEVSVKVENEQPPTPPKRKKNTSKLSTNSSIRSNKSGVSLKVKFKLPELSKKIRNESNLNSDDDNTAF